MARESSWAEVNVKFEGFQRIDFDKRKMRSAMLTSGKEVQREARRLVSRRVVSRAGEDPGRKTGELRRSIRYSVSRPGFLVRVRPEKTKKMGEHFYPAYLYYGVTGLARRKDHKAQPKDGTWRTAPRGNYMVKALDNRAGFVRGVLRRALENALVPRK